MIEINLLPGSGKKKSARHGGSGRSLDFAAALAGVTSRVKDKYLAAAVLSVVVAAVAIGVMTTTQRKSESELAERDLKATQDSSHFAAVLMDKVRSEAQRDTLLRQLNIIRAIDDDRYVWPHILDEVSRALPAFTWILNLRFTGTPQGANNAVAATGKSAQDTTTTRRGRRSKRMDTEVPHDSVQLRIIGETVDIQALTRFMKQLEASPFLGGVQLQKSEMVIDGGQQVTSYDLIMSYTRPDSGAIKRVPLSGTDQ